MFNLFSMWDDYEKRKVANYRDENSGLYVSTARVDDSEQPYETAVSHPGYNKGKLVVVETYDCMEEAGAGHERWVEKMTAKELPERLVEVGTSRTAMAVDMFAEGDWRSKEKEGEKDGH